MRYFLILLPAFIAVAFGLNFEIDVYRSGWLVVGRIAGVGTPVDLGLPISHMPEIVTVPDSTLTRLATGSSNCSIITIPGLNPFEYSQSDFYFNEFRNHMLDAWKASGSRCSLYIYRYPSFFESYWESGKRLARFAKNLKNVTIIAHSKGGLVARCALEDPSFRKNVRRVYFLGTPHLGTPIADALTVDPSKFEEYFKVDKTIGDMMRVSLVMSYTVGYMSSVGSRELSWMNKKLPPLRNYEDVNYYFLAGMVDTEGLDEAWKAIEVAITKRTVLSGAYMMYLAALSNAIGKGKIEYSSTDGAVPVISALAYGKLRGKKILLYGYNHAALYKDVDLISKIMSGSSKLPLVEAMGFEPTTSTLRR